MIHQFTNISHLFSPSDFERVKEVILTKGDRQTFRNYDNNNPHYKFGEYSFYLGADIGQKNINNDASVSDFNQITIWLSAHTVNYLHLVIVRKGDISNEKAWLLAGMKEENVYLVDVYEKGLQTMESALLPCLAAIESHMKN